MGWYGTHPRRSKEWAIQHIGKKACKRCVYRARVWVDEVETNTFELCNKCRSGPSVRVRDYLRIRSIHDPLR